jgi:MEDS: MEthanogen/methylotroph, DcmR Sensory domain
VAVPIFECSRCNELTYSAAPESGRSCPRCGSVRHRVLEGGFGDAKASTRDLAPGDHATMVYDDPALIAPFCARYLTEGIDKGERVMSVVAADLRAATEGLLAPDVNVMIEWLDPLAVYGDFDPDRVAAMYDELIGSEPRSVRILAVLDGACVDGVEPAEMERYECLAHGIVTGHGATGVCLYDARSLDRAFLDLAARRHTLRVRDGVVHRNEAFEYQPA